MATLLTRYSSSSADVVAMGEVDYVAWDRTKLARFKKEILFKPPNPDPIAFLVREPVLLGQTINIPIN